MAGPMQAYYLNDLVPMWPGPGLILTILLVYLVFVLKLGPAFMEKRPAFQLKTPLLVYNIAQVLYSLFLVGIFTSILLKYGFLGSELMDYTEKPKIPAILSHAGHFYLIAKVSELLDTVFFVLRKKNNQVTFLHVYHHAVMVFCTWAAMKYTTSYVLLFIGLINSFVHVIMYTYYGLSAFPSLVKYLWWKKYLTSIQLIQFGLLFVIILVNTAISESTTSYVLLFTIFFNILLMMYLFRDFYLKTYIKKDNCVKNKIT